jgi:glycogen debranching enzyme
LVEGGISIYNGEHQEQGTNRYHSDGNWYTSLNVTRYFAAGDTFQIRAHNWGGASVTFSGTIEFRLICEYP